MINDENNESAGKKGLFSKIGAKSKDAFSSVSNYAKSKKDQISRKGKFKELLNEGKKQFHLQNFEQSKNHLEEGISLLKQPPDLMKYGLEALYLLGCIYGHNEANVNSLEQIAQDMNKYFDEAEKGRYVLELKGILFFLQEKYKEAMVELGPLCAKKDASFYANYYFGFALFQDGKFEDAKLYLQKAVQMEPDNVKLHELLSDAYSKLNQNERAKTHLDIVYLLNG